MPIGPQFRQRATAIVAFVLALFVIAGCGYGAGDGAVGMRPGSPPSSPEARADPAIVATASGAVRGVVAPDYRLFAGIPYAAPPVGPLRWQPPAPAPGWPGVRDATRPGARCIQDTTNDPDYGQPVSEDCLTLNVWTPRRSGAVSGTADRRPVMVWIHGGAFVNGSGDIYHSQTLSARGDILVVTLNYRLGALGFLAHPGLGAGNSVGNYGLADQQAALRWVRANIASFGGDPDKVTIAGESAGGMSVCDHLVAPGSAGLFRAAIIESGPCQAQADLATANRVSLDYAAAAGCGDPAAAASCLRALPPSRLVDTPWYYRFGGDYLTGPVTGTASLPVDPLTAFAQGRAARVPVLVGSNHDEFTLFVAIQYLRRAPGSAPPAYADLLGDTYGGNAALVADHYPVQRFAGSIPLTYAAAVTDSAFACVTDQIADRLNRTAPVYAYEFNDPDAPAPDPLRTLAFPVGASHSLELRYLFDMGGAPTLSAAQRRLAAQMVSYWTSFVTTGMPNAEGQPVWPELGRDEDAGPWMSLRPDGSRVIRSFGDDHRCAFWATLPPG